MDFKKTYFYPVDINMRVIMNQPFRRERDLVSMYRGSGFISLKGKTLNENACYQTFKEETNG